MNAQKVSTWLEQKYLFSRMTILTHLLSLIYEHQYNASQFINNAEKVSDTPIAM